MISQDAIAEIKKSAQEIQRLSQHIGRTLFDAFNSYSEIPDDLLRISYVASKCDSNAVVIVAVLQEHLDKH